MIVWHTILGILMYRGVAEKQSSVRMLGQHVIVATCDGANNGTAWAQRREVIEGNDVHFALRQLTLPLALRVSARGRGAHLSRRRSQ